MSKPILHNNVILFAILLIPHLSFSQYTPGSKLKPSAVTVMVGEFSGTGFFYSDSSQTYIVSACHNFFNMYNKTARGQIAKVDFYDSDEEKDPPKSLIIDFPTAILRKQAEFDFKNDVCVIVIGKKNKNTGQDYVLEIPDYIRIQPDITIFPVLHAKFTLKFDQLISGEYALMVGYPRKLPLNIFGIDINRPLFRSGIIAAKDKNAKRIILDAATYGGNSGGAVLVPRFIDKEVTWCSIGLITHMVPEPNFKTDSLGFNVIDSNGKTIPLQTTNSGYAIVTPIDFVDALVEKLRNNKSK